MLGKLSKKIGLTQTELKIFLFVITIFIVGLVYRAVSQNSEVSVYKNFDYSTQDAEFLNSGRDSVLNNIEKSDNKKVDYKQEVLDFNTQGFYKVKKKILPIEKSININSAEIEDLVKLPGIGPKTANNIVEYRKIIKEFKNIYDLLQVKGIGNSRLNKIKNYIFIE